MFAQYTVNQSFRLPSLVCALLIVLASLLPRAQARTDDASGRYGKAGGTMPALGSSGSSGYKFPWTGEKSAKIGCVQTNCTINGQHYHNYPAVDFFLTDDHRVRAAKAGKIVFRKDESNSPCHTFSCFTHANLVVIQHDDDGKYSWYLHLAYESIPNGIQKGTKVRQGEVIGEEGNTGYSDATHLHFEVTTYLPREVGAGESRFPAELPRGIPVNFEEGYTWDQLNAKPYGSGLRSQNSVDEQPQTGYGNVGGLVKNTAGQPVIGGFVKFIGRQYYAEDTTDGNGRYSFEGVPAGSAQITAVKNGSSNYININAAPYQSQQAPDIVLVFACSSGNSFRGAATSDAATQDCSSPSPGVNNASHIRDVTLLDGAAVSPGQSVNKIWRMKNTGTSTWGSGYKLVFRTGNRMGAPETVPIPAAVPGQEVDLSVSWQIPANIGGGTYTAYWQLRNAQGTYFGDPVWYQLKVPTSSEQQPPGNTGNGELVRINVPSSLTPCQSFIPEVTVKLTNGQLRQDRGDMLRYYSGPNYSDFPHIGVEGTVNDGQEYTFRFYNDHPMVAPCSEGNYTSTWRLWSNGGWVGPEIVIRFSVHQPDTGRPPNKPSLTSPNDWAVLVGQMPRLCARHNGDPDGDAITAYRFVIYDSAQGYDSDWTTSDCVSPQGLGNYGYKWHAKVRDSRGKESDWSEDRYFNIESSTITITDFHFEPASPSNADPVIIHVATSGCGGVNVGGTVYVNTATDGSANGEWRKIKDIGPKTNAEDAPRWFTTDYQEGTHRVRVDMKSCNNERVVQEQHYTLLRGRPSHPYLLSPSNGFWSNSRTITFRWQAAMRANNYTLVVGTTPDLNNPILNVLVNGTEYTHVFDQDYPQLYWNVFAYNEHGRTNPDHRWVGIDRTMPTSTVNTSRTPPLSYETQISISWDGSDPASGVHVYDVQVRAEPNGQWTDWLTFYPFASAIFSGQPGRTYCFRTRAHDVAGNIETYSADPDACVVVDPTQRPPQAWWDPVFTFRHTIVVANGQADGALPAGYPVQLHFDNTTTPTAAELYEASLSSTKGNDIRVVYQDRTEIPRIITSLSASAIDIWFASQADVGASASVSDYALYLGNTQATNPGYTPQSIFVPNGDANTQLLMYFDEGSGTTASDGSGNGNHGALQGSFNQPWPAGKLRTGLFFNGNALVRVEDSTSLRLSNQVTVEAWVRLTSLDGGPLAGHTRNIVSKMAPGVGGAFRLFTRDRGQLVFDIYSHGDERRVEGPTRLVKDRWYHVAGVYDGSYIRLFVDGTEVRSTPYNKPMHASSAWLAIGSTGYQQEFFVGDIDQVRISNMARTSFPHARVSVNPSAAVGEQQTQEVRGLADLAIQSLDITPNPDGGFLAKVILKNQGAFPTVNEFFVHLYQDRVPSGPGDLSGSTGFWVNAPIAPNTTISMTTVLTEGLSLNRTNGQNTSSERTINLSAQVDSTGAIGESDEANNLLSGPGPSVCFASGDPYEDDESPVQARSIALGVRQSHNFHKLGDADWVKFEVEGGKTYILRTFNLDASADTAIFLYGMDSTTLLTANDDASDSLASRIEWTAPTHGTYYLQIRHWNPNIGGCGTTFDLDVQELTTTTPTMTATGTSSLTATGISSPTPTVATAVAVTGTPTNSPVGPTSPTSPTQAQKTATPTSVAPSPTQGSLPDSRIFLPFVRR